MHSHNLNGQHGICIYLKSAVLFTNRLGDMLEILLSFSLFAFPLWGEPNKQNTLFKYDAFINLSIKDPSKSSSWLRWIMMEHVQGLLLTLSMTGQRDQLVYHFTCLPTFSQVRISNYKTGMLFNTKLASRTYWREFGLGLWCCNKHFNLQLQNTYYYKIRDINRLSDK